MERRHARERAKGIAASPSAANSPMADGDEGPADGAAPAATGKKGRKKQNTEGTGRRCANCGQIGHIKTNKKSVSQVSSTTSDYVCDVCNAGSMGTGFDSAVGTPGTNDGKRTGTGRKGQNLDFDKAVGRKRKRTDEADAIAGATR